MNKLTLIIFFISSNLLAANIYVHPNLFQKKVPYSDQYISQGALIKSVDFLSVHNIKVQIENALGIKLQDRNEAHITVITPPEFMDTKNDNIGIGNALNINTIHNLYKNQNLQDLSFGLYPCIGEMQEKNDDGQVIKRVFYLILRASYLFTFRKQIFDRYVFEAKRRKIPYKFDPYKYFPHITIGFIGGDIHRAGKDQTSCTDEDLNLILPNFQGVRRGAFR